MIRALMIDVDGVLVRGRPEDGLPWATGLETDLGIPVGRLQAEFFAVHWPEIVTGRAGLEERLRPVLQRLAPEVSVEEFTGYWFRNDSRIDEALLASIAALRAKGVRPFLCTNQEHLRARYLMEEMALAGHVEGIFYSAALGSAKPDAAFFQAAGQGAAVEPHEILLIDDSVQNIAAARSGGWHAVEWPSDGSLLPAFLRLNGPQSLEAWAAARAEETKVS